MQISQKLPMVNLPNIYCDHIGLKRKLRGKLCRTAQRIQKDYLEALEQQPESQVHSNFMQRLLRERGDVEPFICQACDKLFCHSDHRETHHSETPRAFFVSDGDNPYRSMWATFRPFKPSTTPLSGYNPRHSLYTDLKPRRNTQDHSCRNCGAEDRDASLHTLRTL